MSIARPAWLLVPALTLLVSGCVDIIPDVSVDQGSVRSAIAKGAMKSPRDASIALASLEGAPPAVMARFQKAFAKQAADREISLADAKAARFLVRGYMSAYPARSGTAVAYVYDLFDDRQQRLERVSDELTVPGSTSDAWAGVDDAAMDSLAGRSADDLALVLSRMPVAQPDLQAVAAK